MADLNPVLGDFPTETRNLEGRSSKTRITLPRNSILSTSGMINTNITHSGSSSSSRQRLQSSRSSSFHGLYHRRFIRYENTYRMEPDDEDKVDLIRIRPIATSIIESAIAGYKYDGNQAKQFSAALAERIRNQIKHLPFPRYKIVTQVTIGQKKGQGLRIVSRCLWNLKWDRYITITKETSDAYVTVTIFYIYTE
jgi:hypothetical protein